MNPSPPIFLFSDFGPAGPYVGQMTAAILARRPRQTVVGLMHDAPAMRPDLAAYLLPAVCRPLPRPAIVAAVVDPGVGGERAALVVEAAGLRFVGPDNGLLSRLPDIGRVVRIDWRPDTLSASFHGRDLFAPVSAMLAAGEEPVGQEIARAAMVGADWPDQADRVVYIDAYGNLMLGVDGKKVNDNSVIGHAGRRIHYARTFCEAPAKALFWYRNSQGLVEIAANGGSAAVDLALALGDKILLN